MLSDCSGCLVYWYLSLPCWTDLQQIDTLFFQTRWYLQAPRSHFHLVWLSTPLNPPKDHSVSSLTNDQWPTYTHVQQTKMQGKSEMLIIQDDKPFDVIGYSSDCIPQRRPNSEVGSRPFTDFSYDSHLRTSSSIWMRFLNRSFLRPSEDVQGVKHRYGLWWWPYPSAPQPPRAKKQNLRDTNIGRITTNYPQILLMTRDGKGKGKLGWGTSLAVEPPIWKILFWYRQNWSFLQGAGWKFKKKMKPPPSRSCQVGRFNPQKVLVFHDPQPTLTEP